MRIYLAGPMRGIPHFNFPAFMEAAGALRAMGHVVFNPAERDTEKYGADLSNSNETGDVSVATVKHSFSLREALEVDLTWICRAAEGIALLPGWETSRGAQAEKAVAEALGLSVLYM